MKTADNDSLWQSLAQFVSHIESLKEQINELEKRYRQFYDIKLTDQTSQTDNEKKLITCEDSQTVIFKAETLIPVIKEAIRDNCNVCFVKNHGLFMTSEEGDNGYDEWNISYAEGFDPNQYERDEWYKLQDALYGICGPGACVGRISVDHAALRHVLEHKTDLEVKLIPVQFGLRAIEE
ncbi:TPA: DUF3085 domain-containing protein [Salmonella enterica]|nr:DUF3085 domain-containing protein [Salmonella enterica]